MSTREGLRKTFHAGLLVILPLAVTYALIRWLLAILDSLVGPAAGVLTGLRAPGLGLLGGILLILLTGLLARNVLGRRVIARMDRLMLRIPLARTIYGAAKQITEAVFDGQRAAFRQVVLVEWPRKGLYAIGFVTGEDLSASGKQLLRIFIVSAPNPTTGLLVIAPASEVVPLNLSVEQALRIVVSGGLAGSLNEAAEGVPVPNRATKPIHRLSA